MRLSEMTTGVLGVVVTDIDIDDRGRITALWLMSGKKVVARYEGYTPCMEVVPVPDTEQKEETEKED